MPCISGALINSQIIIAVSVFSAGFDITDPNNNLFKALVDTGAMKTFLAPKTVLKLNLSPIGKGIMRTANGLEEVNKYNIKLHVPLIKGNYIIDNLPVMQYKSDASEYDLIIGMDLILQGSLTVSRGGNYVFCL